MSRCTHDSVHPLSRPLADTLLQLEATEPSAEIPHVDQEPRQEAGGATASTSSIDNVSLLRCLRPATASATADRIQVVGAALFSWSGELSVLSKAIDELRAVRKQVRQESRGRAPDAEPARIYKRQRLLDMLLPIAEQLWDDIESGPTLEDVAARTHYSPSGLASALKRAALTWSDVKAMSRRRNFRVLLPVETDRKIA